MGLCKLQAFVALLMFVEADEMDAEGPDGISERMVEVSKCFLGTHDGDRSPSTLAFNHASLHARLFVQACQQPRIRAGSGDAMRQAKRRSVRRVLSQCVFS